METGDYQVLSDIQGMEDAWATWTSRSPAPSTASPPADGPQDQGLDFDILRQALEQARVARMHIWSKMLEVLPEPRPELSEYAPRILTITSTRRRSAS
jgi:polyribonucleotide nucleotidyltransferase